MTPRTIFSPSIDLALVGGISFLCFALSIAVYTLGISTIPGDLVLWNSAVLTVLINGSHFIASYRLLYCSKELVTRYKSAAIYLPMALLGYIVVSLGIASSTGNLAFVNALLTISGLYLALHYTGQAWGMMASFAFLNGTPFARDERIWLRTSLRVLAFWQMGWTLSTQVGGPIVMQDILLVMPILHTAAAATVLAGIFAFYRMYRRTGELPPTQIVIPFFVIHLWYIALWYHPQALFWVQLSHSIQYLSFPSRVEFNRIAQTAQPNEDLLRKRFLYFVQLAGASIVVFYVMPQLFEADNPLKAPYWVAIVTGINIHHYFIDGCIWHIRNPDVKKDLFSHISAK